MADKASISQLRVYQLARGLEEQIFELAKQVPAERFYPTGNNLRRAASGVAHYINEAHDAYSYRVKVDLLHQARAQAEKVLHLLGDLASLGVTIDPKLGEEYTAVIKQSWGLIKWLKAKQAEKQIEQESKAKDELVAARA